MKNKLGKILLKEKVISKEQLHQALKAQMVFGGRIGSNIIELGFSDVETVSFYLSEQGQIPYAHPNILSNIDPMVIDIVPKKIAEKYKVIPVEVHKKKLRLVMLEPNNLLLIKDLTALLKLDIEPMIAPENQIFAALEKYYNIKRSVRYLSFSSDEFKNNGQEIEKYPTS